MSHEDSTENKKQRMTRRSVLAAAGTSMSLAGFSTAAASPADNGNVDAFKQKIRQANKIRSQVEAAQRKKSNYPDNNSIEGINNNQSEISPQTAWKDFLQQQGCKVGTKRYKTTISRNNTDGISTNSIIDVDGLGVWSELSMAAATLVNRYYVELKFKLNFGGPSCDNNDEWCGLSTGEDPKDNVLFGWSEDCWDYDDPASISNSVSTSSNVSFNDDHYGLGSMGFEVDDYQKWDEYRRRDDTSWGQFSYSMSDHAGIFLSHRNDDSGCTNTKDTTILASYSHTYNGTYGSYRIQVGIPASIGISYGETSNLEHELTTTYNDGDTPMRINIEDATYS